MYQSFILVVVVIFCFFSISVKIGKSCYCWAENSLILKTFICIPCFFLQKCGELFSVVDTLHTGIYFEVGVVAGGAIFDVRARATAALLKRLWSRARSRLHLQWNIDSQAARFHPDTVGCSLQS